VKNMPSEPIKIPKDNKELIFLYETVAGRSILKLLTNKKISKLAGLYMDSPLSCRIIPGFIKKNNIDMSLYADEIYDSFNVFFKRHIKSSKRPIDIESKHLISPCDGLMSVYQIHDGLVVPIKQSEYSISDLVKDNRIADMYKDGICFVFRLCVNHYHRYCYPDSGYKSINKHIDGELHTVRPIALRNRPVFTQNSREYTLIKTDNFSTVLMMEIGAMLVGKIHNHHQREKVMRGEEKGYFEYGGSTIVMLVKNDTIHVNKNFFDATDSGMEIPVVMGEMIAKACNQR